MALGQPILQFGTSRFLQAHVDLFVSEAMETGDALGGITVVQSTASPASSARTQALAGGASYEVHVRGLWKGQPVDEVRHCHAVRAALHAGRDWTALRHEVAHVRVNVIVSNTGDAGWDVPSDLDEGTLQPAADAPPGFPARLLVLLHDRWLARSDAPLSILPCELVSRNAERLRDIVLGLARTWRLPGGFIEYLLDQVAWANTLVDRIVSEPLHPVGAVAEPYALWAVQRCPGLVLPCTHPAIVLVDDLTRHERLKLHLLNLAHTVLAEEWLRQGMSPECTVLEAMNLPALRDPLEGVWHDEVLPVFEAWDQRAEAQEYLVTLRERLLNPFLRHRLHDIAQNHALKKARRLAPVVEAAARLRPALRQRWLRAALESAPAVKAAG